MNTMISTLRDEIQNIDSTLYALLKRRELCAQELATQKQNASQHLFDPIREQDLSLNAIQKGYDYSYIFKEVFSHSRTFQGLICYVFNERDTLFAKLALGLATHVEVTTSFDLHGNPFSSIFYIPHSYVENLDTLYTYAIYYIHINTAKHIYHAMAKIPYRNPVEFSIYI